MRRALLLLLAVGLAVPATVLTRDALGGERTLPPVATDEADALASRARSLAAHTNRLAERARDLAGRARAGRDGLDAALAHEVAVDDADIDAAVGRWLEQRNLGTALLAEGTEGRARTPVADLPLEELLAYFDSHPPFDVEVQHMWEELRKAGRIDELLAAAEARAEANPEDAGAQLDLGLAYLQKLFGIGATPEAGTLAMQADAAFDRALLLEPTNVMARFTKAVSLSNWPPFLGKSGEAVEHFEVLVRQLEDAGDPQGFVEAYLFLGNMYERMGETDKALATWRRGLERFPDSTVLQEQVDVTEGVHEGES